MRGKKMVKKRRTGAQAYKFKVEKEKDKENKKNRKKYGR